MVSIRSTQCLARTLVFSVLLLTVLSAWASYTISEEEQKTHSLSFESKQRKTRSLQADLVQTLRIKGVDEPIRSTGRLYYQAPDLLFFEYTDPADEWMLIRGMELYVKKSDKGLVRRKLRPRSDMKGSSMGMLLSLFQNGATDYDDLFDIGMQRTKKQLFVTLTSKESENAEPIQIENTLSLPDLNIQSIRVRFDPKHQVLYELRNVIRNQSIDPTIFKVPEES
jgi:outer membrane lipoprotein-sorting protein